MLLLTKDSLVDKVQELFEIYSTNHSASTNNGYHNRALPSNILIKPIMKKASLRQLLDHIFFAVIYAIPNLAYHEEVGSNFGFESQKCEKVMEYKLQMQRKVYNEK